MLELLNSNFRKSIITLLLTIFPTYSFSLDLDVRASVLIEADTGKILYQKNADKPFPPASMSKLMTLYIVFDAIKNGIISKDEKVIVSYLSRSQIGSRMFLEEGEKVTISNLIKGAIIQSGNDACIALAEAVSGSTKGFVLKMNKMAKKIGLKNSSFSNVNGLPDGEHLMSVNDLAVLARRIMIDFPEYYRIYGEKEFTWNNIKQSNRNPLLYSFDGADGIKTGHTEEAKYGLVGSAKRGSMRLISVISGADSKKSRRVNSEQLLTYGFRNFKIRQIGGNGFKVAELDVSLGEKQTVNAIINDKIKFPIKIGDYNNPEILISYDKPIIAPINRGDKIATLKVIGGQENEVEIPVYSSETIAKAPFWKIALNPILQQL